MADERRWSNERSAEVAELFAELAATPVGTEAHRVLRDRIAELHLPLVRYFARRLAGSDDAYDDLVQVGAVGLLKAIDRFDTTLGSEFASYAAPTVMGEIRRYQRDSGALLRIPRRLHELQGTVIRAREDLSQELGRTPTLSEIAERTGERAEDVVETLDVIRRREVEPLDTVARQDERTPGRVGVHEEAGFERAELRADLRDALAALSDQERRIVTLRFEAGKTQTEIAEIERVSQMQVSRLLRRGLARMRGVLEP